MKKFLFVFTFLAILGVSVSTGQAAEGNGKGGVTIQELPSVH